MNGIKLVIAAALSFAAFPAGAHEAAAHQQADTEDPELTLQAYRQAVERSDAAAMAELFTSDAQIYEGGKAEGSFTNYLEHHLMPELAEFASFKFSDVNTNSDVLGDIAIASETYRYSITLKDGRQIERLGVATAVLVRKDGAWKIKQHHSSSRNPAI